VTISSSEAGVSARSPLGAIPGGYFGPFDLPIVASRGEATRLWDVQGREYIDYVLGSGPLILGHAHPAVVEAIHQQAANGSTFYVMNEQALALAQRVVDLMPSVEAVKFVGSGAEATFYALRLARAFTGRNMVLKFEGAYHGHHDYSLHGLKSLGSPAAGAAVPDSAGRPPAVSKTMLTAPFNDLETTRQITEPHADQLAAVIVEPVQRALLPQPGFLQGLRTLCDELGALLIFDEVVTGFRLAPGGAQEIYGVTPDLTTLGKILGGGLPLAALAGRQDILALTVRKATDLEHFVYLSGTLNGNALAAAAGLATLAVLENEDGWARLERSGQKLIEHMNSLAYELSIPLRMIGPAAFPEPVFGQEQVHDFRSYLGTDRSAAERFGVELVHQGILVHPGTKIYLSLLHTEEDLGRFVDASKQALLEIREENFVGRP
jgi:glutamate-1-semialdehyde 2,1-aminomutase